MRALSLKLFRDFKRLWAQSLAIALVLACGVTILLVSLGMYNALVETRDAYYERNRFADVFANARRVPETVAQSIAAIDGVWAVETRVVGQAILDLPNRTDAGVGQIQSLPSTGMPGLNVPLVRSGRFPDPTRVDEVAINEPFAKANGYRPGDVINANLNGQMRALTITGTLLSPEFIYTIGPGAMMPDNARFGILWMSEKAVASAFDMQGAFNQVSLKVTRDANIAEIIDRLDAILDSYGGTSAYDRSLQLSHSFIDAEIKQLKAMTFVLPPFFFAITAFLVNMVMGRIVALERSEIGLLKAIGYSDTEISMHYLMLASLIAGTGILIGWAVGSWLALQMALLYAKFFDFPYLLFRMSLSSFLISGGIGLTTAFLGALKSVFSAARLAPAVAMSPPAPPRYSRSTLDRALTLIRLSQPSMMIARSLLRWPVRSGLTSLGLALAVAIMVSSTYLNDSLEKIIEVAFYQQNRQHATLVFDMDLPESALEEVRRLPGVFQAEGQQMQAAILRNGHLIKRVAVQASRPDADLSRTINISGKAITPPKEGLALSKRLANSLDVDVGSMVTVEFLTGRREAQIVPVSDIYTQYVGLGAQMDFEAMNTLFRQAPQITSANITFDPAELDALQAALKSLPKLAATIMLVDVRQSFRDTISQNVNISMTIFITIAVLITFGVTYNSARIQLSERARELASLRILGFSRGQVSYILMGETLFLTLIAQPVGWLLGAGLARLMNEGFSSDLYGIPLVLNPATFGYASLVVVGSAVVSALSVRRRLDRLDLVSVMKTRE